MAERQWFAEGVQVFEEGDEEFFVEGVQPCEDQAAVAGGQPTMRRLLGPMFRPTEIGHEGVLIA